MQDSSALIIFLPLALGVIMLGLGLSLTTDDFRNVLQKPKAVFVALLCQTVILPLACLGIVYVFGLEPALAVGMMLLAASPGGTSANLYSHLADGDVALNITLTAINSALSILTLPLIVNWSLAHFMSGDQAIPLQFAKVVQVFVIVLGPVLIGMWLRSRFPAFAERMARPVKIFSMLFLFAVVAVALIQEWETLKSWGPIVGLAALAFNLVSLGVGYFVPRAAGVERRQATAIGMEIGIHNGTLAIAIALSPLLLNNATMAVPAAIYGLIAFITAAIFGYWLKRAHASVTAANPAH
ncbi:bile acid:sodium symporter family protein [Aminobacter anthyllidis]|uniref:Bile acid:sodium symporter family protein n=1 Tax=Aminobacter anthyllidis TaxID=1035067 RepID=A0A9X1D6I6_9HYPH|nr:bile acid:sodium symporter family protein [Aminobacter anthyllidis]MBT1158940.1 bile acid:sodium symporter family protein [Aminobacter anthyllidis]